MDRGIEKQRIFLNDPDRVEFSNRLADLVKENMLDLRDYQVAFFGKQSG